MKFIVLIKILARYFLTSIFPFRLSVWHQIDPTMDFTFWASLFFVAGLILIIYITWRSKDPLWQVVSFFLLWFFIALLPTSVISLSAPYQENRGYLSGICVMAVIAVCMVSLRGLSRSRVNKVIILSLAGLVLLWYGKGVIERNRVWHNSLTLWGDVLRKYPQAVPAHLSMAGYYKKMRQEDLAEGEYRAVLDIDTTNPAALMGLGVMAFEKGNIDEAETLFLKALERLPREPIIHSYLGWIYEKKGYLEKAIGEYLDVLSIDPSSYRTRIYLAEVYEKEGQRDKARQEYLKVIDALPPGEKDSQIYIKLQKRLKELQ